MMPHIKPFTKSLIRQNISYAGLLILLIILSITLIPFSIERFLTGKKNLEEAVDETKTVKERAALLDKGSGNYKNLDLRAESQLLGALVPDTEDFFSIVNALESLSQKTNFIITSYDLDARSALQPGILKLTVNGIGDDQAFLEFLKIYQFEGGRLITSDSVELSPSQAGERTFSIAVNFYHMPVAPQNTKADYQKTLTKLSQLKKKINITIKPVEETEEDLSFSTKSSPF